MMIVMAAFCRDVGKDWSNPGVMETGYVFIFVTHG